MSSDYGRGWSDATAAHEQALDEALRILAALVDDDECQPDHHGDCQTHWTSGGGTCANAEAKALLARHGRKGDRD